MATSTTRFRHKYWDVKLSQIPPPSLTCVHAIALEQRRMLGKIFIPENSSPSLSLRPPPAACEHPRSGSAAPPPRLPAALRHCCGSHRLPAGSLRAGEPPPRCELSPLPERQRRGSSAVRAAPARPESSGAGKLPL